MAKISRAAVFEAVNACPVPGTHGSLVALKAVRSLAVEEDRVEVHVHLTEAFRDREAALRQGLEARLRAVPGVGALELRFTYEPVPQVEARNLLTTVRHAVVVASGKGGVGKSTVAANLACAMARLGLKVGLLDADLYGPSMGMMFGVREAPEFEDEARIIPIDRFGVKLMSMAFLVEDAQPLIWRGPMLTKALQQFLGDVVWGDLDLLFIDLPPGTGDTKLSLIQNAKVSGAVVVSTPQDVAFLDARKAIGMLGAMHVPVLGVIENMSGFVCPHCGETSDIFGQGGVKAAAAELGLPFLGQVPIDLSIRFGGDCGVPVVQGRPEGAEAKAFMDMAASLRQQLGL